MPKIIDISTLLTRLQRNDPLIIVEVMPPAHFEVVHIAGSINIPPGKVADLAPRVLPDKNRTIVTYCITSSCRSSHQAAEQLERMGYTDVWVYGEGKREWLRAGLPVEGRRYAAEHEQLSK
jgi:rhodanese-related sulfurtransferase